MDDDLAAFSIDDLLADFEAPAEPRHPKIPAGSWLPIDENQEQARRDRVRAAGLASGRIPRWTSVTGRRLWIEWLARFDGDADLARDAALCTAERMIRDKRLATQERLFAIKRVFLGIHARERLDERRERRGLDAVWDTEPWDLVEDEEYRSLPLPLKGLLRLLEYALEARENPGMPPERIAVTPSRMVCWERPTQLSDIGERAPKTVEQPCQTPPSCGARTRYGSPCDRAPEPGRRRCRHHGGAPGTGAPSGNANARRHGRYSAKSREIRALGRLQNRVADLARAQLAVMQSFAQGDVNRIEGAEARVAQCMRRLVAAALVLDCVLAERGDDEGRRRLVEGALRLAVTI